MPDPHHHGAPAPGQQPNNRTLVNASATAPQGKPAIDKDRTSASKNPVKAAFRLVQQNWGRTVSVNACDINDRPQIFRFRYQDVIGNGTFGIVCKAKNMDTDEMVAIKTVFQDQHHQNRELFIIKSLSNQSICACKLYFYTRNEYNEEFLSLVLEYMPVSLDKMLRESPTGLEDVTIRPIIFHFLSSVAYLHSRGICHRDIKPHNVLVDPATGTAKLCDFGCSKRLNAGEPNIQYICARYYRAPEIAFGWSHYGLAIDLWSVGCVMAELYCGKPVFPGRNSIDQLAKIIKVLGTPSESELKAMGQDEKKFRSHGASSDVQRREGLKEAVGGDVPDVAIDLMLSLLRYDPAERLAASVALAHPYFSEIKPN